MAFKIRMYLKDNKACIIVVLTMILILFWLSKDPSNMINNERLESKMDNGRKKLLINPNPIPFFVVLCDGKNKQMTTDKLNEARILLKSAAALTRVNLKFTIFSDSETLYQELVSPMNLWPQEHQYRLQVEFHPVRYPPQSDDLRNSFKPCATFRLLLPELMQHVDAAVYIDTDIIFLHPPEDLLKEFIKFNNEEAAALAPILLYRMKGPRQFPGSNFPGMGGVNSGVFLMNLTRLRSAPGGGFTEFTKNFFQKHKDKLKDGDQLIINTFFAEHPQLLRELGCEWNYMIVYCMNGRNGCLEAEKHGASLVHGCSYAFRKKDRFQALFNAWEEYELGAPIQTLIKKFQERLADHKSQSPEKSCTNANNIASILTKQISLHTK